MAVGTVKWFNPVKGYGFITPEDGGKDVIARERAPGRSPLTSRRCLAQAGTGSPPPTSARCARCSRIDRMWTPMNTGTANTGINTSG